MHAATLRSSPTVFADTPTPRSASTCTRDAGISDLHAHTLPDAAFSSTRDSAQSAR
jgi:hypothetical protein